MIDPVVQLSDAEFDLLKLQLLEKMIAKNRRLRDELKASDDIRAALHGATVDTAKDMVRALNLCEAAFHAGYQAGLSNLVDNVDDAFRNFSKEIMK